MKAILSSREMYSEKSVTGKSYFMRLISDVTDALAKLYILLKPGFCATVFDYWTSFSTAPSLSLLIILILQCSSWLSLIAIFGHISTNITAFLH